MRALLLALALAGCSTPTVEPVAHRHEIAPQTTPRHEALKTLELAYFGAAIAFEHLPRETRNAHLNREAAAYEALVAVREASDEDFTTAHYYANYSIGELLALFREEQP